MDSNTIGSIGVIGAGLMGHSIAMNFAVGGHQVVLTDTTDENLHRAMENVSATLGVLQEQGLVDEPTAQAVPGRIRTSTSVARARWTTWDSSSRRCSRTSILSGASSPTSTATARPMPS